MGGGLFMSSLPLIGFNTLDGSEMNPANFDLLPVISGRYPQLTMFNNGDECGIGAVIPWADRLWAITYSPHNPHGNDHDGLYEITPDLQIIKREESVGETPAGRMIHRESEQLFIGPYAIDKNSNVRVIPYSVMPGRHTAIARHLTDPESKIYYFTMEEGLYEVDIKTLEVNTLYLDSNITPGGNDGGPRLPGYHGKGGYSSQGLVVYANNGRIGTGGVTGDGLIDFRLKGGSLSSWNGEYLANHHGMWFEFPGNFSKAEHPAPKPIASHLKITGDFARWKDKIVFGCDDNARSRFGPRKSLTAQSQSNLCFKSWEQLNDNGNIYGWGGPWVHDEVRKDETSEPFAFAGYINRQPHLSHMNVYPITFSLEIDRNGRGSWEHLTKITVPAHGYIHHEFADSLRAEWIRLTPDRSGKFITAYFHFGKGGGVREVPLKFGSLAPADPKTPRSVGLLYSAGEYSGILQFAACAVANNGRASEAGYYEMNKDLKLLKVNNPDLFNKIKKKAGIETDEFRVDEASVIMIDRWQNRFRLPKGDPSFDEPTDFGIPRLRREVVTERDLFNVHGTIYVLPRENSGDVANIKPIATHNKRVTDFCPWRGLVAITGCRQDIAEDEHFRLSDDGKVGLWLGDFDDFWKLGKPRGIGGPWRNSDVQAFIASDPFLMTGYDEKKLQLSHSSNHSIQFTIEVDVIMNLIAKSDEFGIWNRYTTIEVQPDEAKEFRFPDGFSAHWVRLVADKDCNATATFIYT